MAVSKKWVHIPYALLINFSQALIVELIGFKATVYTFVCYN